MTNIPFSNEQINNDQLPDLSQLQQAPLSPHYVITQLVINVIVFSILIIVLLSIRYQPFLDLPPKLELVLTFAIGALASLSVIVTTFSFFADKMKSYALREQDISFKSGLIFRKIITQPVLRIQHIELKRGPVERKVGLATLQLFSAGGVSHTFEIPGLPLETAQQLRQFILSNTSEIEEAPESEKDLPTESLLNA